ncbi:YheE family protein [Bacillus rubiinfantis]|uniref:YheE family protein n=1 Tax=Bacillus rubiinfantis TaxID=1499680 RepID=UPI0005A7C585|nr:YheE family protein [Bacillus rubiinfantis]
MITHFQYKPLFENKNIPGWKFSFYYKNRHYTGNYHQSGTIEWLALNPQDEDRQTLSKQIHELMLYHVYDI